MQRALLFVLGEYDTCIVATEAEGVRHGHIYFALDRLVERVVQITFRVGVFEVDRWRNGLMRDGTDGRNGLDGAGGAEGNASARAVAAVAATAETDASAVALVGGAWSPALQGRAINVTPLAATMQAVSASAVSLRPSIGTDSSATRTGVKAKSAETSGGLRPARAST